MVFCKKGVFTNFAKSTRKHSFIADLESLILSKKEIPTQMFSCEFCESSHNTIFKGPKKLSLFTKKRHCRCSTRF